MAATVDPNLAYGYGKALGIEGRARGVPFQLGHGGCTRDNCIGDFNLV